jgi:hypothetical protein
MSKLSFNRDRRSTVPSKINRSQLLLSSSSLIPPIGRPLFHWDRRSLKPSFPNARCLGSRSIVSPSRSRFRSAAFAAVRMSPQTLSLVAVRNPRLDHVGTALLLFDCPFVFACWSRLLDWWKLEIPVCLDVECFCRFLHVSLSRSLLCGGHISRTGHGVDFLRRYSSNLIWRFWRCPEVIPSRL